MLDDQTKHDVQDLLRAIRNDPGEHPMRELIRLAEGPAKVTVERSGADAVVYVEPRPDPLFDVLSPREYEVATLVAAGFTNAQIASTLFISLGTVKDHVHSILSSTRLQSRSEVAARWYGHTRSGATHP